jgi:UDP:flavonoid glycosyltransferase YjiC (YdhE family)
MPSKHFVCLTIGSRGDVQPYIALGKALQKEGHKVTIVTHEEYKKWVTGFGIDHRTAGGDPGALMKLSVENKVCSDLSCSSAPLTLAVKDVLAPIFQGELIECEHPRFL